MRDVITHRETVDYYCPEEYEESLLSIEQVLNILNNMDGQLYYELFGDYIIPGQFGPDGKVVGKLSTPESEKKIL